MFKKTIMSLAMLSALASQTMRGMSGDEKQPSRSRTVLTVGAGLGALGILGFYGAWNINRYLLHTRAARWSAMMAQNETEAKEARAKRAAAQETFDKEREKRRRDVEQKSRTCDEFSKSKIHDWFKRARKRNQNLSTLPLYFSPESTGFPFFDAKAKVEDSVLAARSKIQVANEEHRRLLKDYQDAQHAYEAWQEELNRS